MPLPPAQPRTLHHTRRVTCQGYERDDGLWDIEGHLTDLKATDLPCKERNHGVIPAGEPLHDMSIRLTIDLELNIRDVATSMDHTPFRLCPTIAQAYRQLIGMQIAPGFTRKTRELLGGTQGCTHLLELLGPVATTAYQATHHAREAQQNWAGGDQPPPMLNSCHTMADTGTVVQTYWPHFYKADTQTLKAC